MSDKALQTFDRKLFREQLLSWYQENKRTLPWRETTDPYAIWVSEIMLQQTQVTTVIPYFEDFMTTFPTIFDLAEAAEETVLKKWEGLGYYSRARNLHTAARDVVATYDGVVPNHVTQLGDLKGIGPYTRGAVLSIAFNQPEPAVDGNVMRVLSRVLLINDNIAEHRTRKRFEDIVRALICHEDPSSFNQGLMELGAVICTPKAPACLHCPVREQCRAFEAGIETDLPVKTKAKRQRIEPYIVVLIKNDDGDVLIEKRPNKGLLANMWQFPMAHVKDIGINQMEQWVSDRFGLEATLITHKLGDVRHVFSHKIWELTIYEMNHVQQMDEIPQTEHVRFERIDQLNMYPFSVSQLKIMELLKK